MAEKRSPKFYSNELNRMFGLSEGDYIDFTKLDLEDLIAFYCYIKVIEETKKRGGASMFDTRSPFKGTLLEGTLIDGPLARKLVQTASEKEIEGLKERPLFKLIIAKATDGLDK